MKIIINTAETRQKWCKAIFSVASISGQTKFTIGPDQLVVSGVTNGEGSKLDIEFAGEYFDKYEVQETIIFLIQSKHLAMIFKSGGDEKYLISIDENHKYKLNVEKLSDKVSKKFSPGIREVENGQVFGGYKKRLSQVCSKYDFPENIEESTEEVDDCAVNYLVLESEILKKFMEVIPGSIEDFQISSKDGRLQFTGYLRAIKKDKIYIRQPMSLSMSLSLDDIGSKYFHEQRDVSVSFMIKHFKSFLGLVPEGSSFEVFFAEVGKPIVFEADVGKNVRLRLVERTGGEKVASEPEPMQKVQPVDLQSRKRKHEPEADRLVGKSRHDMSQLFVDQHELVGDLQLEEIRVQSRHDEGVQVLDASIQPTITWSRRQTTGSVISGNQESELDQEVEEEYIGKTQHVRKAKGIFD